MSLGVTNWVSGQEVPKKKKKSNSQLVQNLQTFPSIIPVNFGANLNLFPLIPCTLPESEIKEKSQILSPNFFSPNIDKI